MVVPVPPLAPPVVSVPPSPPVPGLNLGVNLDANVDWSTSEVWVNAAHLLRQWGLPDRPWVPNANLKFSADGYPLADAAALTYLNDYPDGTWHFSYTGSATLSFSGIGKAANVVTNGNLTTGDLIIDRSRGGLLSVIVSAVDPANPMDNLRLIPPGYSPDTTQIFSNDFLKRLSAFKTLRFMDWENTNGNPQVNWSDRTLPGPAIQTGPAGVAYEYIIALANQTGKDLWVNIPDMASDDYIQQMAQLFHSQLRPDVHLYLEYSNELWNFGFAQASRNVAMAASNPELTDPGAFGKGMQQIAFKAHQIATTFKQEFGDRSGQIRTVLAAQAANSFWATMGMNYLASRKDQWGEPSSYLYGIAIAPYVGFDQNTYDKPGLTLDTLFNAMNADLTNNVAGMIAAHKQLADQYGLKLEAYETGQSLVALNPSVGQNVNSQLKLDAQNDPRMGQLYQNLINVWVNGGGDIFGHYGLVGSHSDWGSWSLLEDINQEGSPKWDALLRAVLPAGDVNADGSVDYSDFAILKGHYGQGGQFLADGDLNGDGTVDAADLALLRQSIQNLTPDQASIVANFGT